MEDWNSMEFNGNLNTNSSIKNRSFWKTIKLLLADKTKKFSRITLIENKNIVSEEMPTSCQQTKNLNS